MDGWMNVFRSFVRPSVLSSLISWVEGDGWMNGRTDVFIIVIFFSVVGGPFFLSL